METDIGYRHGHRPQHPPGQQYTTPSTKTGYSLVGPQISCSIAVSLMTSLEFGHVMFAQNATTCSGPPFNWTCNNGTAWNGNSPSITDVQLYGSHPNNNRALHPLHPIRKAPKPLPLPPSTLLTPKRPTPKPYLWQHPTHTPPMLHTTRNSKTYSRLPPPPNKPRVPHRRHHTHLPQSHQKCHCIHFTHSHRASRPPTNAHIKN